MMKTRWIFAGAALAAITGTAIAQNVSDRPHRPDRNADVTRQQVIDRTQERFARFDLDRDGRATAAEFRSVMEQRRAERGERAFARLDRNNDGNISRAEWDQSRAERRARVEQARSERSGGMRRNRAMRGGEMRGGRMFGEDGQVTLAQMQERALARFDRMDANRDGVVTAEERREAWRARRDARREQRD